MEKSRLSVKDVLNIILIIGIVALCVYFVSHFQTIRNTVYEFFGYGPTEVYAFDGADVNYNGGLTRLQIDDQKANDDCPIHDDVNDTLYIQDYGDLVCFYKKVTDDKGNTIYPNILFVKTDDGLKFDGALNMHGEEYAGWFGIGRSFTVEQKYSKVPEYSKDSVFIFDNPSDNFVDAVGFSGFISRAVDLFSNRQARIEKTHDYVIQNIYPYFLTFYNNNVEIIQDELTADGDFNYFYTFIYQNAKAYDFGTNSKGEKITGGTLCVDVTNLTVYPLPSELQGKYEIPNSDPKEYFGIYKCNVYLTCNYSLKDEVKVDSDYIWDGIKDDPIEDRDLDIKPLCNISISLTPQGSYQNTTIKSIVEESPVSISFYKDNVLYRKTTFTKDLFSNAKATIVNGFEKGTYTYEIESFQLLFDSHSGTVNITNSSGINFIYSYQNGKLVANFTISPVSSDVDYSNIDLMNYPVRIILNNIETNETTQFAFDTQAKVNESQSSLMKIGRYTYTILSEKLIFGSTSGNFEINSRNRNFDFSFAVVYNRSDLDFTVTVSETANSTNGSFRLSGDSTSVQLLGGKLNLQNYYVNITIFDTNGRIVGTLNHTHSGNGGCSDSWTIDNLVAGTRYTAQMTYANGQDISASGYIEYQSSTFSFDYKDSTRYTFTYSCKEVS